MSAQPAARSAPPPASRQAGGEGHGQPNGRLSLWRDIAIAAVVVAVCFLALLAVDGFDRLHEFLRRHEVYELDEILVTAVLVACAFGWIARRSQRRLADAVSTRESLLRQYRALVDHALDGVFVVAADYTIIAVNPIACRTLGYTADEVVGQTVALVDPAFDGAAQSALTARISSTSELTVERQHRRKDGTLLPVSVRIVPAMHDGAPCTVVVVRDLTEPRQLQHELESTSVWLTLAAEGTLTGLWDWDLRTNVTRYSPSWRRQLGYDDANFDGSWDAWTAVLHPDDAEPVAVAMRELLLGRRPTYELEIRIRHCDGDYRWMLSRAAVVRDRAGTPLQLVGTHTDITRQKQAEEEIRRLNAELVQDAEALAQINADLESFSYSVWHDLRAPLRRVRGFAEILSDEHAAELRAEARGLLAHVAAGAARMEELIDDLYRLSQIAQDDIYLLPIDLSALARGVVRDRVHSHGQPAVAVDIEPGLTAVADRRLLRILLENVIDNACKYTRAVPTPHVAIGATHDGGATTYFVRDNGVGFDAANAARLFTPFQRFHSDKEFTGNGVGLAIVKRIIRLHRGQIWIDSHPGQGTTVMFTLATDAALRPGASAAGTFAP